jgi:hypothetical protein
VIWNSKKRPFFTFLKKVHSKGNTALGIPFSILGLSCNILVCTTKEVKRNTKRNKRRVSSVHKRIGFFQYKLNFKSFGNKEKPLGAGSCCQQDPRRGDGGEPLGSAAASLTENFQSTQVVSLWDKVGLQHPWLLIAWDFPTAHTMGLEPHLPPFEIGPGSRMNQQPPNAPSVGSMLNMTWVWMNLNRLEVLFHLANVSCKDRLWKYVGQ